MATATVACAGLSALALVRQSTAHASLPRTTVPFVPGHGYAIGARSSARRATVRMDTYPHPDKSSTGSTLAGEGGAPLSGTTTPAGIPQEGVPVNERIAYICNDCGYIYDLEAPFEDLDEETYQCPVCTAPKTRFSMQNLTVGEARESNEDIQSIN